MFFCYFKRMGGPSFIRGKMGRPKRGRSFFGKEKASFYISVIWIGALEKNGRLIPPWKMNRPNPRRTDRYMKRNAFWPLKASAKIYIGKTECNFRKKWAVHLLLKNEPPAPEYDGAKKLRTDTLIISRSVKLSNFSAPERNSLSIHHNFTYPS